MNLGLRVWIAHTVHALECRLQNGFTDIVHPTAHLGAKPSISSKRYKLL